MNSVVIEHVPLSELSAAWREKLGKEQGNLVTLRIEREAQMAAPIEAFGIWRDCGGIGAGMTTIQIIVPDELAQKATSAGLLSAEAIEEMLREELRDQAGEALQAMWQRAPREELAPEMEREIVDQVHAVHAQLRLREAG
ncbi:MAG: hypothetical protein ACK515_23005 [bacterium]|jgi:hypothetical protein|nr:hypothetical protein [Betaproteobacteria bacterium]